MRKRRSKKSAREEKIDQTMILFSTTSIIVAVLSYVLDIGTSILLLVLDILGPLALPFGILTTTKDIAWGWIYRYAEVAFYRVLAMRCWQSPSAPKIS